jgi:ribosomal protein S18 acetylase RimI-like enzyme
VIAAAAAPQARRALASDRAALAALWSELLAHHAALDAAFALGIDARSVSERTLARLLRDPVAAAWIAPHGPSPAGFCAARVVRAPVELAEAARAEITELWVRPAARRGGLGTSLAGAALAWAREQGAARVEVRVAARNAEGQAFWRALGFGAFVDVLDRRL